MHFFLIKLCGFLPLNTHIMISSTAALAEFLFPPVGEPRTPPKYLEIQLPLMLILHVFFPNSSWQPPFYTLSLSEQLDESFLQSLPPTPPPRPVSVRHFVCGRVTPSCFGSNYLGHISYLHSPLPFVSRAGIQQDLYQSDGGLRFVVVLRFKAAFAADLCAELWQSIKVSSYTAQCPVLRTGQGTLHFAPWQTCSIEHPHSFSGKHSAMLQLMCKDYSYINIHHCHILINGELEHYVE